MASFFVMPFVGYFSEKKFLKSCIKDEAYVHLLTFFLDGLMCS